MPQIISIAQAILFVVIPAIVLLVAVLLGFKRNIFQSIAKIVITILAIIISVIIVKFVTPSVIGSFFPLISDFVDGAMLDLLFSSSIGQEGMKIVSAIIMPIVFTVVFAIIAFLFWILYCIPKKLLSDKKLAERSQAKTNIQAVNGANDGDIQIETADELCDAQQYPQRETKKILLRIGCVVLSVLSSFLVLAHLALPVSYYPQLINDISGVEIVSSSMQEVRPAVNALAKHPVIQCYRFVGTPAIACFDSISSTDGKHDSVQNTLNSLLSFADVITKLEGSELEKETFTTLAGLLDSNPYLDSLLLNTLQEMLAAWERGEAWFGIEKAALGDDATFEMIYEHIAQCDNAASVLRLIGDALTLVKVSEEGINEDTIETIVVEFSSDGISMVENVLKDSSIDNKIISSVSTEKLAGISGALSAIEDIKNDSSMEEEEKKEILVDEAQAISNFYELVKDPKNADPEQIGNDVANSKTISEAIFLATDNGKIKDPFDIADKLPATFLDSILSGLQQGGASDELLESTRAFFGK